MQAAAGLLTGLFAGLALGLLRPLLVIAVGGLGAYLVATVAIGGPPAVGGLLARIAEALAAYPVFFAAMGAAKAFGCVLALRR